MVSVGVSVLPDSPSFPYRRYDRLPPIHQFSIESDSDLSETAELIEEYEVFDPSRPRPKVILVIGKESVWPVTRLGSCDKPSGKSYACIVYRQCIYLWKMCSCTTSYYTQQLLLN